MRFDLPIVRFPFTADEVINVYLDAAFSVSVLVHLAAKPARVDTDGPTRLWFGVGEYFPHEFVKSPGGAVRRNSYGWLPLRYVKHPVAPISFRDVEAALDELEEFLQQPMDGRFVRRVDELVARAMVEYFAEMSFCDARSPLRGYYAERLQTLVRRIRSSFTEIKKQAACTAGGWFNDSIEALTVMEERGIEDSHLKMLQEWLEADIVAYLRLLARFTGS